MFNIQYPTMHKVHMHAGAIRQLLYGCVYVWEIIHSLKLVDYLPIPTQKPYDGILHLYNGISFGTLTNSNDPHAEGLFLSALKSSI